MNTVSPNYPADVIAKMNAIMEDGSKPTTDKIDSIVSITGKSKRSVVAKLSTMGLYKALERKKGAKRVTKSEVVARINSRLGVSLPSLAKATMADLEALTKAL